MPDESYRKAMFHFFAIGKCYLKIDKACNIKSGWGQAIISTKLTLKL
jgi:hypothetical protein